MKNTKLPDINIIEACRDPRLLGIPLSAGQEMVISSILGLPLSSKEQIDLYEGATGRHYDITSAREYREACLIAGRRFGKTLHVGVPIACFEAAFRTHQLRPGERASVLILSPTKDQSDIMFRGIRGVFRNSPVLERMIVGERADRLILSNNSEILVWAAHYARVRGLATCLVIAEEAAFWRSEEDPTTNPAEEIFSAVRPSLLTFPHGKLLMISSPWSKSGPVWSAYKNRAERPETLVLKMTSTQGNPTLDPALLKAEQERDSERFDREVNAEFVDSASALLPPDAVDACTVEGRWEVPPKSDAAYKAGIDAGFRSDCFGFALTHAEGEKVVVDVVRSWKPRPGKAVQFVPVMTEIVEILRRYGCYEAFSDQVANEVIKQYLAEAGINLEQVTTLGRRASAIYSTLRAKVLAKQAEFPENAELLSQLKKLEIIVGSGGSERCEASSGKDDLAIATALSIFQCVSHPAIKPWIEVFRIMPDPPRHFGQRAETFVADDCTWRRLN